MGVSRALAGRTTRCRESQGLDVARLFLGQIDRRTRTNHCRAFSLSIVNHPAFAASTNQKSRLQHVVTHWNKTPKNARKKHSEHHALDRRLAPYPVIPATNWLPTPRAERS